MYRTPDPCVSSVTHFSSFCVSSVTHFRFVSPTGNPTMTCCQDAPDAPDDRPINIGDVNIQCSDSSLTGRAARDIGRSIQREIRRGQTPPFIRPPLWHDSDGDRESQPNPHYARKLAACDPPKIELTDAAKHRAATCSVCFPRTLQRVRIGIRVCREGGRFAATGWLEPMVIRHLRDLGYRVRRGWFRTIVKW